MPAVKFNDQANVFKKKKKNNCIVTTHFQMRDVLFTDAFNSRCQFVPLLLQRPGVVFSGLKAEHLNKKEGGRHIPLRRAQAEM